MDYSQYLKDLDDLARTIERSMCRGYVHLARTSEKGEDCPYAQRAKNYFLREEEGTVRSKLVAILKTHLVTALQENDEKCQPDSQS